MPRLFPLPQTPAQAVAWPSSPFATTPAAAHSLLHPGRHLARYPAVAYLTSDVRNYPMGLMQKYWPAGASDVQALQGLGANPDEGLIAAVAGAAILVMVVGAVIRAGAGYYVGKAAAPDASSEGKYALGGAVAGLVGGPLGLAATAGLAHWMRED